MAHTVVKIITSHDGEKRETQKWCYVAIGAGDLCTLCEGEYFGLSSSGCEYKIKEVKRGGITCDRCLTIINTIKAIKL